MSEMPTADCDAPALIERVLADHALVGERYLRDKCTHADVCACGTLHPPFADGRWQTHRRHVAEQIARALPPAKCPECGGDLSDGVCPNDAYQRRAIPPALSASDVEAIVRSREKHRANGCKVHDEKFARCTCPIPPAEKGEAGA